VAEPFAHELKGGALLCSFCPRRCRLTRGQSGTCGALTFDAHGLRPTRAPGSFRLRTLATPLSGLLAFPRDKVVVAVETGGSGLQTTPFEGPAEDDVRFTPEQVVFVARAWDAGGIHLSSDDPVFDVGEGHDILTRAHAARLKTAVTTSGFLLPMARDILFDGADVVNLRLWSMSQGFYGKRFGVRIEPVLATVEWLAAHPGRTVEVTVPLTAGANDSPMEIERLAHWIARSLGPSVPLHFEAEVGPPQGEIAFRAAETARSAGYRALPAKPVEMARARQSPKPVIRRPVATMTPPATASDHLSR
jgi:pyruvate formate lyase activating enzyme